jgi:hypothetical protein
MATATEYPERELAFVQYIACSAAPIGLVGSVVMLAAEK